MRSIQAPNHSAAGKTSFYYKHFQPKGYAHVNQDTLKSRDACLRKVRETISLSRSGVVVGEFCK